MKAALLWSLYIIFQILFWVAREIPAKITCKNTFKNTCKVLYIDSTQESEIIKKKLLYVSLDGRNLWPTLNKIVQSDSVSEPNCWTVDVQVEPEED